MATYNAEHDPNAELWLSLDEGERQSAITLYHEQLRTKKHPPLPNPRLHAAMHMVVENQLAMNEPPDVRSALAALRNRGMGRHDAIHAIGSAVTHLLYEAASPDADQSTVLQNYVDRLRRISAGRPEK